ncbi:thiamine pyrophosphate-binding protein (plasmid) [Deinococcus psychrotolerans]|uniref:Thiamine pyrophosphate-binding protein n=1 Tax=Deinococcus psychrotolerans TaxID=2489213 RepID=A0A3G8YTF8_9DEIO|nr:thiamine pyrophosphate-binding protein [Deinococcus psychrotolerans]AZI44991.1 thiamine pyrophosphate-binding protein [Deinococcus psychrotolerans]
MTTVAEAVGQTLAQLGVGHAFGVVGSGNFHLTNALRRGGVPFTAARHEGGAASMADAYARMSGQLAVLTTHQGCGLTNAVTGLTEAAKSRTPLLAVTADTQAGAVRSNFRIDQDGLARSIGAVAERVYSPASAVADTVRAYRTAVHERRTVVLSVPLDVQAAEASPFHEADLSLPPAQAIRPDAASVSALVELLSAAERPVFVAGRGARHAKAELKALAAQCGALLATSAVAHGLFAGDAFNLGISGGFSSPLSAELIRDADLIVAWGCTLNMWTMRHGQLIGPETKVVQVDVEDAALGSNRPITLGVRGDCAQTADDVLSVWHGQGPVMKYRTPQVAEAIAQCSLWRDTPTLDLSTHERIDPRVLSRALDDLLPRERVVSIDSGNFMGYPSTYLSVPDEFGFCFTQAFQSIGLGLGSAIGAALAQPGRLPVLGSGDGGFLMAISELETAVRLKLPLVCIIYNDAAYGAEVHHFVNDDHAAVRFPDTDLAALGRGFGADGVTVRTLDDLNAVRDWLAAAPPRPLVIDAKIASDGGAWWLQEAFKGH